MKALALLLLLPVVSSAQTLQVLPRGDSDPIVVVVSNGPGNRLDWVTLTASVSPDNSYLDWYYLNGSKSQPMSGTTTATVTFPAPANGTYNVRLFASNTLAVKLATSAAISVGGNGNQVPTEMLMFNGDSITAPQNITGAQNWTAIVAAALGYQAFTNLANNDKYASDVLAEVPLMGGQVCMVMIGTNDMVGAVLSSVSAAVHRAGYLDVMEQLIVALKPRCGRVVVLSPPLSMSARETLRYPAVLDGLRVICAEQGVTFLNVFQHMADLSAIKTDAEVNAWYSDWRHLTAAGHAVIAEFISKSLKVTP